MSDLPHPTPHPVPVQPGVDTAPEVAPSGLWGFFLGLAQLAIGLASLGLAVRSEVGGATAEFAADVWRVVLGAAGAVLGLLALRGLTRVVGARGKTLTAEVRRTARIRGRVLAVFGAWVFACSVSDAVARETVTFGGWASPFFRAAGLWLTAMGVALQLDPTARLRRQQLRHGPSVPGNATIVGARDAGMTTADGPVFELDLEIHVNGRDYPATTSVVLEAEKAPALAGSTVDVVVDLVDPDVFDIDWRSWRPSDRTRPDGYGGRW